MCACEENGNNDQLYKYNRKKLYFSVAGVYILFVGVGALLAWPSPAIPKLIEENHNFTSSQKSLLASITGLSPGPFLTMFGIDTLGRKGTLVASWITLLLFPIIMLISQNIYVLLLARFIGGIGATASFSAIGIYISEISDTAVRGALNNGSYIFLSIGMFVSFAVGPFVTFNNFSIFFLCLTSLFGIFVYSMPESPYYYMSKNKGEKAKSSLMFLRGKENAEKIEKELSGIEYSIEEERKAKTGIKKMLTSRAVHKQLAISFFLLYLQQGTGVGFVSAYAQDIFDNSGLNFKGAYVPIIILPLSTLMVLPQPFIVKKFGVKHLLRVGAFGPAIILISLAVYMLFIENGYHSFISNSPMKYSSIVIVFLLFVIAHGGLGGIVWGTISDLYAPSIKGTATGICGEFSTFIGFLLTEIFGEAKERFNYGPAFLGFGIVQLLLAAGIFFVPDTSKMSLQEVQEYFENKSETKRNSKEV